MNMTAVKCKRAVSSFFCMQAFLYRRENLVFMEWEGNKDVVCLMTVDCHLVKKGEAGGEKSKKKNSITWCEYSSMQKYTQINSIKPNSVLIIVGAGRLGPALRGSCDLCTRLTMRLGNNSCCMVG